MQAIHTQQGAANMRIPVTKPLFAWDCLEDSPTLKTVRQFLESIPDAPLLDGLQQWRGRGRNDYPVHVLWGVVLLVPLLRPLRAIAGLIRAGRGAARRSAQ